MSTLKFSSWQDLNGNEVANSSYPPGLVLVKTQTIGTSVSSVTVTDAFSATFDNYRVVVYVDSATNDDGLGIRIGGSATQYYGSLYYDLYTGSVTGTARVNNSTQATIGLTQNGGPTFTSLDIANPNATESTILHGTYFGRGYSGWFGGVHSVATAYTSLSILPLVGTITGGTIKVYGYNNG